MTLIARLIRKHLGAPRYREDLIPSCFDPQGTILRAGERRRHSLVFYFWALSQSI
jgi:hypothetical protein